jgi:hypothetical protein
MPRIPRALAVTAEILQLDRHTHDHVKSPMAKDYRISGFRQISSKSNNRREALGFPPSSKASNTQPDVSEENQVWVAHPCPEARERRENTIPAIEQPPALDANQPVWRHLTELAPSGLVTK